MDKKMNSENERIKSIYRKRARHYDFTANLYYLIGFREWKYRRNAVQWLGIKPGDTVVEIGCGTGLNFPFIEDAVGDQGKIIGVDLTSAMLKKAEERVRENGWKNIELVNSDASSFRFPSKIDGVISTFALSLMPDIEEIMHNASKVLVPGKRIVVLDLKLPKNFWGRIWPVILPLVRPFAVNKSHIQNKPWEIILREFYKKLKNIQYKEVYGGYAFIIGGEV